MIGVAAIVGFLAGLLIAAWSRHAKARPLEQQRQHTKWAAVGVGGQNDNESVDAQWTREIMHRPASGRFFDIHMG